MQDEINEKSHCLIHKDDQAHRRNAAKIHSLHAFTNQNSWISRCSNAGKQTLKQLMKQNAGVSSIEITDSNIKAFESTAKNTALTLR